MEVKIVIGLGYGDEGKGITTDFLARNNLNAAVIRQSGGQQATHNVEVDGKKHAFSSYGSGTMRGLPSYTSHYCTFYPPNILNEHDILNEKGIYPFLGIHKLAKMTCPADVAFGRLRERIMNHGSCGIGVGATMSRNDYSPFKLYMADTMHPALLGEKLKAIDTYYRDKIANLRLSEELETYYSLMKEAEDRRFFDSIDREYFKHLIPNSFVYKDLLKYDTLIFEGSQGIMLDMEHGVFPNVTYANTTSKNAIAICKQLEIKTHDIEVFYVTRCYQTRHGEGWMSSSQEISLINNEGEYNVHNDWQKDFKVAEIDYELLKYAANVDSAYAEDASKSLVVTCLDQRPDFVFDHKKVGQFNRVYGSYSPDSKDFKWLR